VGGGGGGERWKELRGNDFHYRKDACVLAAFEKNKNGKISIGRHENVLGVDIKISERVVKSEECVRASSSAQGDIIL